MPVKPQVYKDARPAEFFEKYHRRVRAGRPDSMYKVVRLVLTGPMSILFRARIAAPPDRGSDEGVRRSLAGESRQENTSEFVSWFDMNLCAVTCI